jgi:phosphoribosyl-ATP pyrophosphohydrolase/phosphoribosyl-AMP cyclohydrolase
MPGLPDIAFDDNGLAPCVAQDHRSGAVLTLAWVNAESLAKTVETGDLWFYSRSRGELWHKGETSGNYLRVRDLRYDCDADAVLALVEPAGPACHTGEATCFFCGFDGEPALQPAEAAGALQRTLDERRAQMPEGSYTTKLLADRDLAMAKVLEEAEEVTRAVREESDERVAEEAADLLYHLAALMTGRGMALTDALAVLAQRHGTPARHSAPGEAPE